MLRFQSVTLRRGTRAILQDVNATIHSGEHWGIVGRNGSGKSSLLALVLGTRDAAGLHADIGEVALSSNFAMAHVAQETPAVDRSAIDYVMDGDTELRELEQQLAAHADADTLDNTIGNALDNKKGEQQALLFA
jgi:ATP-binding cassette subfamily F protein 3